MIGLREMGFNIPKANLKPQHVLDLNEKQIELLSASDIGKSDVIELQEITDNLERSTDNLIEQLKGESSERTLRSGETAKEY